MVVLGGTQPDFIPAKNCKKAAEAPNAFASEDIPLLFSLSLGVYRMFDISVAANVTITDDNLTEDLVTQVTALSLSNQDQATKNTTTRAYIYHDLLRSNITALSASDNGSSSCDMINAECYEHIKERFGGPQDNGCRFHGFPEACSEYMSQNLVQNGSFWVVGMFLHSLTPIDAPPTVAISLILNLNMGLTATKRYLLTPVAYWISLPMVLTVHVKERRRRSRKPRKPYPVRGLLF